jgi:hypothetical protein
MPTWKKHKNEQAEELRPLLTDYLELADRLGDRSN